ncbi:MAG: adenylosuccinate synthase [Phototrophicales bacterium]|nr:MAG: adenylosuccinate synthase [Phototrophicales bacterium]
MPVTICVGAQWGDEGKGRVVDWLASESDVVARYAGGDNAGHTISIGDTTFKLHLIPSGILQPKAACVLGSGMVVNPQRLLDEIQQLQNQGVDVSPERLFLSDRAHVITPGHIALDTASEESRAEDAIGTTQRGIGPAYTDKVLRQGLQVSTMRSPEDFADAVKAHIEDVNMVLQNRYQRRPLDADGIATMYADYARQLQPYIVNTTPIIHNALQANQRILCEGAQGTLLDLDLGHYPFVTSSSPSVGGALIGLGFGPTVVDRVVGVTKAFSTRVGSGPMPTEQKGEIGDRLRGTGEKPWDEFGTTTGRPRRCGWLDGVVLRYAARVNGFTELVLTKLDVLTGFEQLKIAVAYKIDGQTIDYLPSSVAEVERAEPIYETLDGWSEDIMNIKRWEDLPANAQRYVNYIADFVGVSVSLVSVGPERTQIILK